MPAIVLAVPLFIFFADLGPIGTYPAPILAHLTFLVPFVTWMMRGFFLAVPVELDEAATIDGASRTRFYLSVPLTRGGLAATAIFCVIDSWNELQCGLILTNRSTAAMPVAVPGLMTPIGTFWGQIAAVGVVTTVPMLVFALLVQRHIVRGMDGRGAGRELTALGTRFVATAGGAAHPPAGARRVYRGGMTDPLDPLSTIRPLIRTRQVRQFTTEPLTDAQLHAITEVARWSGSSRNNQPWRFIVIREPATLRALHQAGEPQTRSLESAVAAVAIVLPADPERLVSDAYDDGRAAERMLIAANMLGLGAAIAWVRSDVLAQVRPILQLPADRMVRTILALGHPTEAALAFKSPPGQARLPREESVHQEHWPTT